MYGLGKYYFRSACDRITVTSTSERNTQHLTHLNSLQRLWDVWEVGGPPCIGGNIQWGGAWPRYDALWDIVYIIASRLSSKFYGHMSLEKYDITGTKKILWSRAFRICITLGVETKSWHNFFFYYQKLVKINSIWLPEKINCNTKKRLAKSFAK